MIKVRYLTNEEQTGSNQLSRIMRYLRCQAIQNYELEHNSLAQYYQDGYLYTYSVFQEEFCEED